jgi:expansin (peptidoglycan-binding protein)
LAVRKGNHYHVNGRVYGAKPSGNSTRLYPVAGDGVHRLSRNEFKALGVYNDLGIPPRVELIIARMGVSLGEQYRIRELWQMGKDFTDGVDRD